jgi:multisubunit Na+/H+ antiporter MnhB subunit
MDISKHVIEHPVGWVLLGVLLVFLAGSIPQLMHPELITLTFNDMAYNYTLIETIVPPNELILFDSIGVVGWIIIIGTGYLYFISPDR